MGHSSGSSASALSGSGSSAGGGWRGIETMSMSRLLIPFAVLTRSAVAGAATVSSAGKALPSDLTCPGTPECSGHGICKAAAAQSQCHCAEGYFGHDCGHRHHDCAKLRSCSDCQHAANQRYCGWCVEDRYCVPKHVHAALLRKGKGCAAWYEDTCPARKGGISSSAGVRRPGALWGKGPGTAGCRGMETWARQQQQRRQAPDQQHAASRGGGTGPAKDPGNERHGGPLS